MSAAYSRSSMKSKQPPPSARHARPRAPGPSEPHGSGLQVRICSSSCLSWLHLLKSWSLRQSRGGSDRYVEAVGASRDAETASVKELNGDDVRLGVKIGSRGLAARCLLHPRKMV